jgi:hypothetical protein
MSGEGGQVAAGMGEDPVADVGVQGRHELDGRFVEPGGEELVALFLRAQRLVPNRGAEDLLCRGGELA